MSITEIFYTYCDITITNATNNTVTSICCFTRLSDQISRISKLMKTVMNYPLKYTTSSLKGTK